MSKDFKRDYYTVDDAGNIFFTPEGLEELAPYFHYAGIDIKTIKTKQQYLDARTQARPYFWDWMIKTTGDVPDTLEGRALMAIVKRDFQAFDTLRDKIDQRNRLGLKRIK